MWSWILIALIAIGAYRLHLLVQNDYQYGNFEFLPENESLSKELLMSKFPAHSIEFGYIKSIYEGNHVSNIHYWLMMPVEVDKEIDYPVVILSHGIGSQKDMGLDKYAIEFNKQGFAALLIDYSHFGGSSVESQENIRNLINPWQHVRDIKSVIEFVKTGILTNIDTNSIILCGTSFAGGHMLQVASEVGNDIKGVISQVPYLDGRESSKKGIKERGIIGSIRTLSLAVADLIFSKLGLEPIYVPIVCKPGDVGYMMLNEHQTQLYYSKHPSVYLGGWKNLAPARTLIMMSLYNPIDFVDKIQVPVIIIAAENDDLCPLHVIEKAHKKILKSELVVVPGTHFDIYSGDAFDKAITSMITFAKSL